MDPVDPWRGPGTGVAAPSVITTLATEEPPARGARAGAEAFGSERCPGCGATVPRLRGPAHPYAGAAPGCWAIYGEILAREYGEFGYPPVHRLTVDAYAVQHPGEPSRRSIQSLAVHLIGLCVVLERGYDFAGAAGAIRQAVAAADGFAWLEPPPALGALTVVDVRRARDVDEHTELVDRWAEAAWAAWAAHHGTVRAWVDRARLRAYV